MTPRMRRHSFFLIIDLRPPLLSRWPHFLLAASAISPLDDDVRCYPGQARADARSEVLIRRPLPVKEPHPAKAGDSVPWLIAHYP